MKDNEEKIENQNIETENSSQIENLEENNKKGDNKKSKIKKKSIILLLVIIAIIACGVTYYILSQDKESTIIETENDIKKSSYTMKDNELSDFDLYFLKSENNEENIIYSPLSIKYGLSMLQIGAQGDSKKQIDNILGDYQFKKYENTNNISLANALFVRESKKEKVNKTYTDTIAQKYNATLYYDPFTSSEPLNKWVSSKTFNLINGILDDQTVKDNDFVLVNALAIDMEWKNLIQPLYGWKHFYAHETECKGCGSINMNIDELTMTGFTKLLFNNTKQAKSVKIGATINNYDIIKTLGEENIRKTVGAEYEKWLKEEEHNEWDELLSTNEYLNKYISEISKNYEVCEGSTDFSIYNDDSIKVFAKELKEYSGTTLEYIGIMPKEETLKNYIDTMDSNSINNVISKLKEIKSENFKDGVVTNIIGEIPLFAFNYNYKNLQKDIENLGITDVFKLEKANLTGLTTEPETYIKSINHKANIDFSNEGIKASAALEVAGGRGAGGDFDYYYEVPVETIDMTFDKPYLFIIRDKNTHELWFVGAVYEPSDYESGLIE